MVWTDGIVLKVVNIVVFAALLGSNIYSVAGPEDIYRNGKETWVTPSYYANYVWSLIHLLLFFLMFYQFSETGFKVFIQGIQWRFALLAVLNQAFVWFWVKQWFITAFILSLIVAATVSQIYYTIKSTPSSEHTTGTELFIELPFSLWHAYSIILVILAGFEAFGRNVHSHNGHPGIWTKIFVFFAFLFLETTAAAYAFASREGDIAGGAVIAFYLFAVFIHQNGSTAQHQSAFVKWTSLVFFILSLVAILKSVYGTFRKGGNLLHDEERAPLIGSS